MAAPNSDPENDNVFFDNSDPQLLTIRDTVPYLMDDGLRPNVCSMLDPAGSSSSSNSRKPSYDSRESKSISECSYISGSPCESPLQDLQPIGMATPYCSTCTMESEGGPSSHHCHKTTSDIDPFHSEKDFIDYLMSLPSSKTDSTITLPTSSKVTPPKEMMSLKPKPATSAGGTQSPKIGLDHLENLCKLMEQLGELREQNFKLQKRVQYLEEVRCLNEMRKDLKAALLDTAARVSSPIHMRVAEESADFDFSADDAAVSQLHARGSSFCEPKPSSRTETSRPPSMEVPPTVEVLPVTISETKRAKSHVKLRKSNIKQQRARSQSMGDDDFYRQSSHSGRKAKVSKWTKVKEALKWERVQVDNRGSNSGLSGPDTRSSFFVNYDVQQPLMISKASVTLTPMKSERQVNSSAPISYNDLAQQKTHKQPVGKITKSEPLKEVVLRSGDAKEELVLPHLSRELYLETSSDEEADATDNTCIAIKDRKGRSLERDSSHSKLFVRYTQSDKECKKLSKGAWGKVKNIIQTRKDSLKRKHRKSGSETESKSGIEPDFSSAEYSVGGDDVWVEAYEIPGYGYIGLEEASELSRSAFYDLGQIKSKHSSSSSNYGGEDMSTECLQEKPKVKKGKAHQLTIQVPPEETSATDGKMKSQSTTPPMFNIVTSNSCSPNSQRKSKWTKVKKVFLNKRDVEMGLVPQRPQSVPASPTNLTSFTYEDLGLLEEYLLDAKDWAERKEHHSGDYGNYDSSVAALQNILGDRIETEQMPMSIETKKNLEEMQRNLSQDFSKKMQEWEKLKTNYTKQQQSILLGSLQQPQHQSPKLDRKGSTQKSRKGKSEKGKENREQKGVKQREKELQWLEKQLQKIEREKQRLSKERQKYLEREARLEKMKETMMKPTDKNEILIRTPAGEFRFEGISQTFTRKLYEWEEMKGIGPEVSTIALLDGQNPIHQKPDLGKELPHLEKVLHTLSPPVVKYGRLDRHRSRSESSITDIVNVQTSTTSLAPDDLVDDVFSDGPPHSRANSEPDIAFNHEELPCAVEVEEMHFEESIPCLEIPAIPIEEPVYSYAPSEVTHLIDSSGSSDVEKDLSDGLAKAHPSIQNAEEEVTIPEKEGLACPGKDVTCETLMDEDIKLLEKLTAKEEICRRLESDLENLDGRMKMMFQQHAEEIQKLKSQEGSFEENEETANGRPFIGTAITGSPPDTVKQKHRIENLKARIDELEKAGECLKKEREDIEKTFRLNSEQQAQLTQNLAARINQLQHRSNSDTFVKKRSTTKSSGEGSLIHSKKKAGVLKVQELSAELLQQAKTLEQALLERNTTIRQLQWELLQRDMSAIHLQTELQKVKEKTDDVVNGNDCKKKGNHNRSWSSVDASCKGSNKHDEHQPLNIQRYHDNPEFIVCPQELTQKVRELKTELMRLWSSNESTTSFSSEIGIDDTRTATVQQKDITRSTFTAKTTSQKDQLNLQTPEVNGNNSTVHDPTHSSPIGKIEQLGAEQRQDANSATIAMCITKPTSNREVSVTARRVSDTSIPRDCSKSPELPKEKPKRIAPSKLPRSPEMKKSSKKKVGSSVDPLLKHAIPKVSMDSKSPPLSVKHQPFPAIPVQSQNHGSRHEVQQENDLACSNILPCSSTTDRKPQPFKSSGELCGGTDRVSKLKKLGEVAVSSSSTFSSQETENVATSRIPKDSLYSKRTADTTSTTASLLDSSDSATTVVIPVRKTLLKSECLPYLKKKSLVKDGKAGLQLQRQNAEDAGSSSDTDTEGSGITFTISLGSKMCRKSKDSTKSDNVSTIVTAKLPLCPSDRPKESGNVVNAGCILPVSKPSPLESRFGPTPPESPSFAPWRKSNRMEMEKEPKTNTDTLNKNAEVGVGQMPTPTGASRVNSSEAMSSSPAIPKRSRKETPASPETPVVKSRSTRKLKLPVTGKASDMSGCASPAAFMKTVETSPSVRRAAPGKDAALNVKLMIEKYNKKLAEEQPSPSLLRSPHLGLNRSRNANGVQKSTSFTNPSTTSPQTDCPAGESVIKSASASTIEGACRSSPSSVHSPPMSPETSARRAASVGQPIGIASRIPRCLKAITEHDSSDTSKDDATNESKDLVARSSDSTHHRPTTETGLQSPKTGLRALEIRRAREEFLTKIPAPNVPSPVKDQGGLRQAGDQAGSQTSSPFVGWKSLSYRSPASSPSSVVTESPAHRAQIELPGTSSDIPKPKGILKPSRKEKSGSDNPIRRETNEVAKIVKSASAGAMEDSKAMIPVTDDPPSDSGSRTSDGQQITQKSGLFNFKFRKAKLKHKKEPLNAVKALCRQSLLVDIQPETEYESQCSASVSSRSCPSSPDLQPRPSVGRTGWLTKPRILFKSK